MQHQIAANARTIEALSSQVYHLNQNVNLLMGALGRMDSLQSAISTINLQLGKLKDGPTKNPRRLSLNLAASTPNSPVLNGQRSPGYPIPVSPMHPLSPRPSKVSHPYQANAVLTNSEELMRRTLSDHQHHHHPASILSPSISIKDMSGMPFLLQEGDMITIRLYQSTRFLSYAFSAINNKQLDHFIFREYPNSKDATADDDCLFFVCGTNDKTLCLQSVSTAKYITFKEEKSVSNHGNIGFATDIQPAIANMTCVDVPLDTAPPDILGDGHPMRFKGPKNLFISAIELKDRGPKKAITILGTKSIRPNMSNLYIVNKLSE
jgi:hypothetical protein